MHGHWSKARHLRAVAHELRHELAVLAEAIVVVQQDHRVLPPDELTAECRAGAARVDRALLFHHIERDPRVVHHDAVLAWEVKSEDLAYVYESLVVSYMAREIKNTQTAHRISSPIAKTSVPIFPLARLTYSQVVEALSGLEEAEGLFSCAQQVASSARTSPQRRERRESEVRRTSTVCAG